MIKSSKRQIDCILSGICAENIKRKKFPKKIIITIEMQRNFVENNKSMEIIMNMLEYVNEILSEKFFLLLLLFFGKTKNFIIENVQFGIDKVT